MPAAGVYCENVYRGIGHFLYERRSGHRVVGERLAFFYLSPLHSFFSQDVVPAAASLRDGEDPCGALLEVTVVF